MKNKLLLSIILFYECLQSLSSVNAVWHYTQKFTGMEKLLPTKAESDDAPEVVGRD